MPCNENLQLDIVIPVYNEGRTIAGTLSALESQLKTPFRVLICYDFDEDDTLAALKDRTGTSEIRFVKNIGRGPHRAVISGFEASEAPLVLVYPADDDYNAGMVDSMVQEAVKGRDIVCASRFMPGGSMVDCPWLKNLLVRLAGFSLHRLARVPTHDASNGFRMFSRRLLDTVRVESTRGFSYSIELLAKCHRLGWPIAEVPAQWHERTAGKSRFQVMRWLPAYLRWYFYAFATTYMHRGPELVPTKATFPADGRYPDNHTRIRP
jgi:dolichol-phosphate mannosyltransferase